MAAPVDPDWEGELERWLRPFLEGFRHKAQRRWAPVYVRGLVGPARRKSVSPMARVVAPGDREQLHHFVCASPWDGAPLAAALVKAADGLVGGPEARLVVDDTALVKKGRDSVGVAPPYCGELGKKANCQSLVSVTLAQYETPVCVGLRLFLPASWETDQKRRRQCGVPEPARHQPKWEMALEEIDRVRAAGARFGEVLADAAYGMCAEFRRGLTERELTWTVGVPSVQLVYPADVTVGKPKPAATGRPRKHSEPSTPAVSAQEMIVHLGNRAFHAVTWRQGTKGPLRGRFAAVRVRVADGPEIGQGRRLPGQEAWLIGEQRSREERRYYLSDRPAGAARLELARSIKGRWACEQPHQQMKQELGLDHFEGRTWIGLHHHALMTMIAFAFLQHLRLKGKKNASRTGRRLPPVCPRCAVN
ncbi:MAG: IS701 family transposase [Candidatus Sumerlaeota bacterium]|nr:IS701 family transposase [Candidatus Sumerlaeota bacterium]